MSLRDYFAGQMLAGVNFEQWDAEDAAKLAYNLADAMIKQREKK